jgi:PhzF family phenazine biosynthesis protein
MEIPIYQVDAFTQKVFGGNPAAVCPLRRWLPDSQLQSIAAENNLSETAFFVRGQDQEPEDAIELRWFTPTIEVDLCGHATLAAAFVLTTELDPGRTSVRFVSRFAGELVVDQEGDRLVLDFPARPPAPVADTIVGLSEALGAEPSELHEAAAYMAVFDREAVVRTLEPEIPFIAGLKRDGLIVTAPGEDCDFVSRYFAPHAGIPEDPVTGAAHCTLTPYWARRLGRDQLRARQVSRRGGDLVCENVGGERVRIAGCAVLYLKGTIYI